MAKRAKNPEQSTHPRDASLDNASPLPPRPRATARYDAPGDEPLTVPTTLTLDEPFRFDRGLSKRLRMREINAKEAFTLRDVAGTYFRASLKEYDGNGGRAVAYERMTRSPEP